MKKMMDSSLERAGKALDVNERDFTRIKKASRRRRLAVLTLGWLIPILSFVAGFLAGTFRSDYAESNGAYPLAAASVITCNKAFTKRVRFTIVGTIVLSAVALVLGFMIGAAEPETTATTRYGVLSTCEPSV